ncbi:MAG: hypothetical protein WBQ69_00150 [Gallionella sp.]
MPDISPDNQDAAKRKYLSEYFPKGGRRPPSYQSRHGTSKPTSPKYVPDYGEQHWKRAILTEFAGGKGGYEFVSYNYTTHAEPSPEDLHRDRFTTRGDGDREASIERSRRRAKKVVRHHCKNMMADRMNTLSTQMAIYDRSLIEKMVREVIGRIRKATKDACHYVAVLEQHDSIYTSDAKRGSYHVHLAMHGRQDCKLWWNVWQSVCAKHGTVGRYHCSDRKLGKRSPGQIASYMSK